MGAQSIKDFYFETRVAHETHAIDGTGVISNDTGFRGQWLNMRLDGEIAPGLTYSYRQRFTKATDVRFFDATDWIHIDWKAMDKLSLSAGKQVVAIGGYEYDRAPIDLYYCSEFWNNIACYQMGVSATYNVSENDALLAQFCNSPFRGWIGNNTYALNLMWYGNHGFWETMWSFNTMENVNDTVMNYIALGNRFNFTKKLRLDVDLMTRSTYQDISLFDSMSLMTEFSAMVGEGSRVFAKYTFDKNDAVYDDVMVHPGTWMNMVSAGAEFNLLKQNRDALRFFCVAAYNFGDNANPDGTKMGGETFIQAGLKWKMRIK